MVKRKRRTGVRMRELLEAYFKLKANGKINIDTYIYWKNEVLGYPFVHLDCDTQARRYVREDGRRPFEIKNKFLVIKEYGHQHKIVFKGTDNIIKYLSKHPNLKEYLELKLEEIVLMEI